MQPITTVKMGLLSALLCLNANTALSQTVKDFPRPTIKKGDIPKPKPSIPKADIPKPQSPATPRVNIPSNNPGIALPERPKPQTTIYSFVSYPYQKPDPNGVTHVSMLNDQQQYRMYHCPIAKAPIDPALLKSGALDTLAAMQPAVETFQINQSEKAFSIKTKKGIELQFPDQAFADGLGNPVVGKITLSVQSFQSKTDFASAQLTSSTSNGDALISGGMLNVEAKSGNANLRISDGKSYKIIGNGPYEDGFRTFYGVQGEQTTWSTYASSTQNGPNDNNDPNSKNAKYTLSLLPITRSSNGVAQPLAMRDDDRNIALSNWFFKQAKISKELKKQIKRDGVIFPAQLKINAQGKITDVQLLDTGQAQKSLISPYFTEFRKLLMSAPPVRFLDTFPMPEILTIRFSTLNENFATIKQLPLPPAVAGLAKMATAQDGKWVLESYSTQMVNCDRFARFPKTDDSITYSVDRAKALVYLNFKDYNALLGPSSTRIENTGYSYTMKQFPVGAKARLIAVVYNDQGQVHLEVADVSEGNYRIEMAQQYPFNQLTIKAAFEMMPMDLFESKK